MAATEVQRRTGDAEAPCPNAVTGRLPAALRNAAASLALALRAQQHVTFLNFFFGLKIPVISTEEVVRFIVLGGAFDLRRMP